MFVLLKHTEKYKGIITITHIEYNLIEIFKKKLSEKYYIYGCSCYGYPNYLRIPQGTYFTDNIFYKNRISDITYNKFNILLKKCNIDLNIKKEKYFDFIHIGRGCDRKNQIETYNIMKKCINLHNKKCLLILIPDKGKEDELKYINNIFNDYNKQNDKIKENLIILCTDNIKTEIDEYCVTNSFSYEELSLFFNFSKIYIHSTCGFDEARIIGQSLLSENMLLCNSKLEGHDTSRKNCKNAIVEYNMNNIDDKIKEVIEKQLNYNFDDNLNNIYNEDITVVKELEKMYKECKYDNFMLLEDFIDKCDKKLWSLKVHGHYNQVVWNVKKTDECKFGNPTQLIQDKEQYELLFNFLNV